VYFKCKNLHLNAGNHTDCRTQYFFGYCKIIPMIIGDDNSAATHFSFRRMNRELFLRTWEIVFLMTKNGDAKDFSKMVFF
jgi:hypothetical protein